MSERLGQEEEGGGSYGGQGGRQKQRMREMEDDRVEADGRRKVKREKRNKA